MKKILLIVAVFGFLVSNSYSEEDVLRPEGKSSSSFGSSNRTPWAIGLEAGVNYNMFSSDLNWTDANGNPTTANSVYNVFESLTGISPHFGVFVDYDIDEMFGIHLKLLYNGVTIGNTSKGIYDFYDASGFYLETDEIDLELKQSLFYLNVEPLLRINATQDLYFLIGPSFNYGFGSEETTITLTEDNENVDFLNEDGTLSNSVTNSTSNDFKETRYALNIGAGYKFEVDENIFIAPQVIYSLGLNNYNDAELQNTNQFNTEGLKTLAITNQAFNQIRFSITLWFENL